MKKAVKNGSIVGLSFAGIALLVLKIFGTNETTLTVLLYFYIATGIFASLVFVENGLKEFLFSRIGKIVVVIEGEELILKKLATGEKYAVKGDLEKIQ